MQLSLAVQQIRLLWWEIWSGTPQGFFLGPDLTHVFIDDLDEVGEAQCSALWVDKPGGRPEGVGTVPGSQSLSKGWSPVMTLKDGV